MPSKVKSPCRYPGCTELVESGNMFCKMHKVEKDKEYNERRGSSCFRGYDKKWQKVRLAYLKTNPLCEECLLHSSVRTADMVHHIKPISEGGSKYSFKNLKALCNSCHGKHHRKR